MAKLEMIVVFIIFQRDLKIIKINFQVSTKVCFPDSFEKFFELTLQSLMNVCMV